MSSGTSPYGLSIEGFEPDHVRVHSLAGEENLSKAWRFDLDITVPAGDDLEQAALGRRACVTSRTSRSPSR
jgi:hypothetical protein